MNNINDDDQTITTTAEDAEIISEELPEDPMSDEVQSIEMVEEDDDEKPSETAPTDRNSETASFMDLEDIIKRHIRDIDRYSEEIKKNNDMYTDIFEQDKEYADKTEVLEQAKKDRNTVRDRLMSQASVIDLSKKITEAKQEIKDLRESLASYLEEYQKTSDNTQIEIDRGDVREIVKIIKLVKKSKYRP